MNSHLYLKIFILFNTPLEQSRFLEHLLSHIDQSLNFIASHHFVLHLSFNLLDACCCHVSVAHSLYFLHSEAWAQLIELSVQIIENAHHVTTLLLNDWIEIANVAEENSDAILAILPTVFSIFTEKITHKFRNQYSPYIISLINLHLDLFTQYTVFARVKSAAIEYHKVNNTTA